MDPVHIQILISILTIFGSGVSVYVGVRVSIAEIKRDIKNHDTDLAEHSKRLDRLENPYFAPRARQH